MTPTPEIRADCLLPLDGHGYQRRMLREQRDEIDRLRAEVERLIGSRSNAEERAAWIADAARADADRLAEAIRQVLRRDDHALARDALRQHEEQK